jgi:hypothetical protein
LAAAVAALAAALAAAALEEAVALAAAVVAAAAAEKAEEALAEAGSAAAAPACACALACACCCCCTLAAPVHQMSGPSSLTMAESLTLASAAKPAPRDGKPASLVKPVKRPMLATMLGGTRARKGYQSPLGLVSHSASGLLP